MKLKLLVVEDHEEIRNLFFEFIGEENELDFAINGIEGFSFAQKKEYDLIISDLNLPEMEGLEMMRRLREKNINTPFIVITGHNTLKNEIDSFRLGALDFLVKPFSFDAVLDILDRFKKNFLGQKKIKVSDSVCLKSKVARYEVSSMMEEIPNVVDFFMNEIGSFPKITDGDLLVLKVVLFELLANAIEHGNAGVDYFEKQEILRNDEFDYFDYIDSLCKTNQRKVFVEFVYTEDEIKFTIQDEGDGFEISQVPDPTTLSKENFLSGRGIFIAKLNIDSLKYNDKGNIVTAVRKLGDILVHKEKSLS